MLKGADRGEGGGRRGTIMYLPWFSCLLVASVAVTGAKGLENDVRAILDNLQYIEAEPGSYGDVRGAYGDLTPPGTPEADLDRFLYQSLMNTDLGSGEVKTVGDLMAETNDLLEKGHLVLTRRFTEQAHRYNKAVRNVSSVVVTDARVTPLTLEGEHPPTPDWNLHVTGLHLHTHGDHTLLLLGSLRSREQRVVVWSRGSSTVRSVAKFQLTDVSIDKVDRTAIYMHGGTLFMVLGSSHSRLVSVVCVGVTSGRVMLPQVITQRGVVGALHLFVASDQLYLVVGESHYANPGDGLGRSEIYLLVGEFFDKQETLTMFGSSGVRDITSFASSWGTTYIVLGMHSAGGSQVYALDTGSKVASIALEQELEETRVWRVAHFRDQADLKHFVVVLNLGAPSAVYWWNGNQLVRWQTLDTPEAPGVGVGGSLALLPLPNFEHLIFASVGANITIYTYHTTGTHEPSFIVTTQCSAVMDMAAAAVGSDFVLVYVCEGPVSRVEARIIHLEALMDGREDMMEQESQLSDCLDGLRGILDSRKPHVAALQHIIDTDALMTVDHAQVWSGPITVPELWVGQTATLQHTVVIPPEGVVGGNQSRGEFEALVARLQTEVREVQATLGSVLYYAGIQTIRNPALGASLFATTAQFDVVSVHRLHGVALTSLTNEVLLDGPDQTITGHWQLTTLSAQRLSTRTQHPPGSLNGVQTADYMRGSVAGQVVTGRHIYRTVTAGRVCHITGCGLRNPLLVNGLSTAAIVRQRQDVTFTARKTFARLLVRENVDVAAINGVSLAQVLGQVIFTDVDGTQVLSGRHSIQQLTVGGNLVVAAVNGVNVAELEKALVKRQGDYRLTGSLVYKSRLVVRGNTEVRVVNGVPWGELLPLNAPVNVPGAYTFSRATVTAALHSDNINGLDLSRDVVLIDTEQTIEGRIRFMETVRVTGSAGVRMGEGATVNGVDPSEVASGGSHGGGGGGGGVVTVVVENELNLSLMQVSGNVVIPTVNGVALADLERLFWRKSVAQEVNVPVHIREAVFLGGVEGGTLNGHAITEYLQLNANQRITGRYSFEGSVEVAGNIVVAEGRTVAGVDVSSLPGRLVTVDEAQTLEGEVRFSGRVTVVGDLDLRGDFSGLQVLSRALRLDQTIKHTGHLTFAGGALMTSLQVTSSDLTVTSINGLDVAAAAADLVLVDEDATITGGGGVRFSGNVNIRELRVSGLVDGVDLSRMVSRALRTSSRTPQVVSAALTVEKDVHFAHGPTLARVNDEDWATYLGNVVQVGFAGLIEGRKLFTGGLRVSGNLQARNINGVQLNALATRILRKSSQQLISAHYTFLGDVTADELSAPVIDGVVMDEVVLVSSGGQLGGTVTFAEDVTLLAGLTADSDILDSCDFSRIKAGPVVGGDGQSLVDLPGMEIDTLVIEGRTFLSSTITTTTNLDIMRLLHSLVLKSTDQVITGSVMFLNDVRVGELSAAVVDGVDVQALFTQAVLRGQDVVIECDLHLTEGLQVGRLEINGNVDGVDEAGVLVNGVDLSAVAGRAVRRDGGTYVLSGRKVFTAGLATRHLGAVSVAGVSVQDMVVVGGGVVGRPPPRLVFRAPVVVLGDLWVSGLVDGVDLARLFAERVTMDGHQTLAGTYHFEALRVEGDITTSSINNVSLDDLVLRTGQARQVITGAKVIAGGLQVRGGLHLGRLNGVDVAELNRTIVTLDQGTAAMRVDVRFEGTVECLAGTEVVGAVNGHDLSVLAQRVSQIQQRLVQERRRIDDILGQFGSLNDDNYIKARELYAEMASLERIFLPRETTAYGMLWWGAVPGVSGGQVLRITSCHVLLCGCDLRSHYFMVGNDTRLKPVPHLSSDEAITTHLLLSGQHLLVLHSKCVGEDNMQVRVSLAHRTSASLLLQGVLVDSEVFQADGHDYLVAALYRSHGDAYGEETVTEVVVVRVDAAAASLHVVTQWVTKALVVDVDVTFAGDSWFLLLANSFGHTSIDKFVTASEVLRWDSSSNQFRGASQHLANHVSSGSFVQVMGETFLVLAQDMSKPPRQATFAASCSSKVMVYRYKKSTRQFVEFQSIPAYGVVSQTIVRVDRSVYLVLASPTEHCLYVCLYKHSEGFVVTSQVFLTSPLSVVSVAAGEDTYVLVSTVGGVERYKVFVKGVDPDTLYL